MQCSTSCNIRIKMRKALVISRILDDEEREYELWNEVFKKLARVDGLDDNLIDRSALVKLIWGLDLDTRIKLESSLDLSLEKVESLLKKV